MGKKSKAHEIGIEDGLNLPKFPPIESLKIEQIGICSKPFQKQLTKSDLKENQNRLYFSIGILRLISCLKPCEDVNIGIPVIVCDSKGRKHSMTF